MKLYDFDGMFEEKLADYIKRNPRGYTEKQWEDAIPALYAAFGDTPVKSLGVSPNAFYAAQSDDELVASLRAHIKKGIPVSEYLCNAVEGRNIADKLLPLLSGGAEEAAYAVNLIGARPEALPEYMRLIVTSPEEDLVNSCIDYVKELADLAAPEALTYYKQGVKPQYMLEILSRCTPPNDEVFAVLISAFRTADEHLALCADFLASFGDERALPYLLDRIEEEGLSYADFLELKYAVEALGGSYKGERDFSSDPDYELIKSHGGIDIDIFKDIK